VRYGVASRYARIEYVFSAESNHVLGEFEQMPALFNSPAPHASKPSDRPYLPLGMKMGIVAGAGVGIDICSLLLANR
jgi:hypothetical protein